MKTIARKILVLGMAGILSCALVSCGFSSESTQDASTSSESLQSASASSATPRYDRRLDELVVDNSLAAQTTKTALSNQQEDYATKVEAEYQLPELPSGCEVTSLTMVLRAMGFELGKTEIADNYLIVNGSEWGFLTSPYESNGGGFPPGIVDAANSYLETQDTIFRAHNLTNSSFDAICALVDSGVPVCVWTTLYFDSPDYDASLGGTDTWFINEHCVVLYKNSDSEVYIANPLEGFQTVDKEQFANVYEECGSMALAIW